MSTLAQTAERSIFLDTPAEEVREALADEAFLSEWLQAEVELEPPEGGADLAGEAERLSFRWHREGRGESQVELIVEAVADGTRLTVVETSLEPGASPLLAASWTPRLASLRLLLGRLVLA